MSGLSARVRDMINQQQRRETPPALRRITSMGNFPRQVRRMNPYYSASGNPEGGTRSSIASSAIRADLRR